MKKYGTKWIKIIICAVLLCGIGGCVEEPIPIQSTIKFTSKPKTAKNTQKPHTKPLDSKAQNTSLNLNDNKQAQSSSSYNQDLLEKITGEQSSEEVEENGRTYQALITYKPGTKIKHGKETLYYPDGSVAQVAFYIDGKREGLYQIFSQKGVLIYEAYYKNGYLHGLCKMFNVVDGSIKSEMNFANGTQDGEMKIYNTSGTLWHILEYKGGRKNGIAKEFDARGKVVREVLYNDDIEIKRN